MTLPDVRHLALIAPFSVIFAIFLGVGMWIVARIRR